MNLALEITNYFAAALNIAVAALLFGELRRRRLGWPPIAIIFILFFTGRALERLTEPEAAGAYSPGVDVAVDVGLMFLLVLIIIGGRSLADAALATLELARYRVEEYTRARRHYAQLVRHRIANPLTVIAGAAQTLAAGADKDPSLRRQLVQVIVDSANTLKNISLDPEQLGPEEQELHPTPSEHRPNPESERS
jgi:signal transduction histidine kinase